MVYLDERCEIRYGFVNANNWHNVQIRLDVVQSGETLSVKQVVSYQTDDDIFNVIVTEDKVYSGESASVFYGGV